MPLYKAYAISGILICLLFFPLGLFTRLKGKTPAARFFSYHLLAVGLWGLTVISVSINSSPQILYHIWNIGYCTVLFIPIFMVHTILILTNRSSRLKLIFIYGQAVAFSVLTLGGVMFSGTRYMFNFLYYNQGGVLYLFSFVVWLSMVTIAHLTLIQYYRKHHAENLKSVLLLILAIPFGFGGGLMNFLPGLGFEVYPIGNFFIPIYSIVVAYAIFRYQFLEIAYVLRKGLTYIILIAILSTIYFLMLLLFGPFFDQLFGEKALLAGFLAAVLLGAVFAPLRLKIEYLVDTTFFKKSHHAVLRQNELLRQKIMYNENFKIISTITQAIVGEVRDPLAAIRTHCQDISKRREDTVFIKDAASKIEYELGRVNELLSKLLKFVSQSAPQLQRVAIHEIIQETLRILQNDFLKNNIQVSTLFQAGRHLTVLIDPSQFQQALYNIVRNAIEAMSQGGTLTISTSLNQFSDQVSMNFDPDIENFLLITIADTGRGILKDRLPYIFDPFYSPHEKKIGLGLSFAHKIIRDHGGNIGVTSEEGRGTTFSIELPIKRPQGNAL